MNDPRLHEEFAGPNLDPALRWHCEPQRWSIPRPERCLRLEPEGGTDFWRKTHYGFEADNGHFLYAEVSGDFSLATHVCFQPKNQYDQAGLMVRIGPTCWLKTSVEYEPEGPSRLGAVVTRHGYSDWSTQAFAASAREIHLRVRRSGEDYTVESSSDGRDWTQIRLAHLEGPDAVWCGLYACSPKAAGYVAEFRYLTIDPA
jgi:regulation of enolase protein 1 (concanavalin A-like superfamily)